MVEPKTRCCTLMCVNQWPNATVQSVTPNKLKSLNYKVGTYEFYCYYMNLLCPIPGLFVLHVSLNAFRWIILKEKTTSSDIIRGFSCPKYWTNGCGVNFQGDSLQIFCFGMSHDWWRHLTGDIFVLNPLAQITGKWKYNC